MLCSTVCCNRRDREVVDALEICGLLWGALISCWCAAVIPSRSVVTDCVSQVFTQCAVASLDK